MIMARLSIIALLVLVTFVVSDAFVSPKARWASAAINTKRQARCAVIMFHAWHLRACLLLAVSTMGTT